MLYTRYPIVARRAWPAGCIGRVRRASKGILQRYPAMLHPIPRMDDFDRLGETNYFSVLDATSGSQQLPLVKKEGQLTAFVVVVAWEQYEFLVRINKKGRLFFPNIHV